MKVKQIAVKLPGDLFFAADLLALLAGEGINVFACSLVTMEQDEKIMLKMIVNDTDNASQILATKNLVVDIIEVAVVEIPDKPGGLAGLLQIIKDAGLQLFSVYAFSHRSGEETLVVIDFADIEEAVHRLDKAGARILSTEELLAK